MKSLKDESALKKGRKKRVEGKSGSYEGQVSMMKGIYKVFLGRTRDAGGKIEHSP